MSIHQVDKLMEQTRKLAADYYRATQQALPVSAELARHDAMRLLNLVEPRQEQSGVDAVGADESDGVFAQIKGRVIFDENKSNHRIGQLNVDGHWNLLVLVLFDGDYQVLEIYQATRDVILEAMSDNQNPKRNKRGAMSVAKFKAIAEMAWNSVEGDVRDQS